MLKGPVDYRRRLDPAEPPHHQFAHPRMRAAGLLAVSIMAGVLAGQATLSAWPTALAPQAEPVSVPAEPGTPQPQAQPLITSARLDAPETGPAPMPPLPSAPLPEPEDAANPDAVAADAAPPIEPAMRRQPLPAGPLPSAVMMADALTGVSMAAVPQTDIPDYDEPTEAPDDLSDETVPEDALAPADEGAAEDAMAAPRRPRIALVIDDLGLNAQRTDAVIALPAQMTLAFLPYGRLVRPLASQASRAGHELIVHLPMEPHDGAKNPGPNALLQDLPAPEFLRRVAWSFEQFDGFVGFNNHMGSRLTEDRSAMKRVMGAMRDQDLYFLDSLTSGRSVALASARAAGIPSLARDIFIDHVATPEAIREQLDLIERKARSKGRAIAIGHPFPDTIAALAAWIPAMKDQGFEFVPVSTLIAPRGQTPARVAANVESRPPSRRETPAASGAALLGALN